MGSHSFLCRPDMNHTRLGTEPGHGHPSQYQPGPKAGRKLSVYVCVCEGVCVCVLTRVAHTTAARRHL